MSASISKAQRAEICMAAGDLIRANAAKALRESFDRRAAAALIEDESDREAMAYVIASMRAVDESRGRH